MVNSYLNPMTGLVTKGNKDVTRQQLEGWMTSCIVINKDSQKFQRMTLSKMDMKKPDNELDNDSIMQVWHSFVHKVMEHYQFGIEFEVDQVQQALDQITTRG
jgi:uncharacterized protein (DUF2147 family)